MTCFSESRKGDSDVTLAVHGQDSLCLNSPLNDYAIRRLTITARHNSLRTLDV